MTQPQIPQGPQVLVNKNHSTAVAILLGIVIGLAIWFLGLQGVQPFTSWILWERNTVQSIINGINPALTQIGNAMQSQPIPAAMTIISLGGGVYGIASKIASDRAATAAKNLASQQISDAQQEVIKIGQKHALAQQQISNLQDQLSGYQNDTSFTEAQQLIQQQTAALQSKSDTITELEGIIQDMKQKTVVQVH